MKMRRVELGQPHQRRKRRRGLHPVRIDELRVGDRIAIPGEDPAITVAGRIRGGFTLATVRSVEPAGLAGEVKITTKSGMQYVAAPDRLLDVFHR
jgi:hypothetical protein